MSSFSSRARSATASVSVRSRPCSSTDQVTARYIAPVSRYRNPSRVATPRAVLDLPEPLGPSTAMIMRQRLPVHHPAALSQDLGELLGSGRFHRELDVTDGASRAVVDAQVL